MDYLANFHSADFFPHCWAKFYRSAFIHDNNLLFNDKLNIYEDICWLLDCLEASSEVLYFDLEIYCKLEELNEKKSIKRFRKIYNEREQIYATFKKTTSKRLISANNKNSEVDLTLFFIKRLG